MPCAALQISSTYKPTMRTDPRPENKHMPKRTLCYTYKADFAEGKKGKVANG